LTHTHIHARAHAHTHVHTRAHAHTHVHARKPTHTQFMHTSIYIVNMRCIEFMLVVIFNKSRYSEKIMFILDL